MVLAAAVLFSTGGAAIKATAYSAWQVAGIRSLLAVPILLWLVPRRQRQFDLLSLGVAAAYATMMVLFVLSNKLTTAANAIFLQSTSPFYIVLLSPLLLQERMTRRQVPVLVLMALGMGCFVWAEDAPSAVATDPWLGNLAAMGAGAAWGLTVMGLRRMAAMRGPGSAAWGAALGNLGAAAAGLTMAYPLEVGGPVDWGLLLYLGVAQIGLAYVLLTRGVASLPALETALLLMVEPAISPIWAWGVHGELPSTLAVVGAVIISGGVVWQAVGAARGADPSPDEAPS